eukprot:1181671-Prorocentrum_minimum.AAC.2
MLKREMRRGSTLLRAPPGGPIAAHCSRSNIFFQLSSFPRSYSPCGRVCQTRTREQRAGNARKPQNPTNSEEYQGLLQGVYRESTGGLRGAACLPGPPARGGKRPASRKCSKIAGAAGRTANALASCRVSIARRQHQIAYDENPSSCVTRVVSLVRGCRLYLALDEGLEERERLLRAVRVDPRHVEVVDEGDELLAHRGPVRVLRALLRAALDVALQVHRARARRKVHRHLLEKLRVEPADVRLDGHRLRRARVPDEQHRPLHLHERPQQPARAHLVPTDTR